MGDEFENASGLLKGPDGKLSGRKLLALWLGAIVAPAIGVTALIVKKDVNPWLAGVLVVAFLVAALFLYRMITTQNIENIVATFKKKEG